MMNEMAKYEKVFEKYRGFRYKGETIGLGIYTKVNNLNIQFIRLEFVGGFRRGYKNSNCPSGKVNRASVVFKTEHRNLNHNIGFLLDICTNPSKYFERLLGN